MRIAWARHAGGVIGAAGLLLCTLAAHASTVDWPGYAVRIVSVHAMGSIDDPISRPLALALKQKSQFQVALQHHPSDAQPNGLEVIAASRPNGQTVGVLGSDTNPSGLRPIALLATTPLVLAAHPEESYRGFQDVIRAARQQPGRIVVGVPGPESPGQLAIEEFNALEKTSLRAIAYKSSGPLIADLVSGRMGLGVLPLSAALSHAQAGRIRVLGISSASRDDRLPNARTLASQGLENYELSSWWGAFGPKQTADELSTSISNQLVALSQGVEFAKTMRAKGIDVSGRNQDALQTLIDQTTKRWASVRSPDTQTKEK